MSTQLRLIEGPGRSEKPGRDRGAARDAGASTLRGGRRQRRTWQIDEKTRRSGRRGVAAARRALDRATPPAPAEPLRRAG